MSLLFGAVKGVLIPEQLILMSWCCDSTHYKKEKGNRGWLYSLKTCIFHFTKLAMLINLNILQFHINFLSILPLYSFTT